MKDEVSRDIWCIALQKEQDCAAHCFVLSPTGEILENPDKRAQLHQIKAAEPHFQ